MNAEDLIRQLRALLLKHGDLPVVDEDNREVYAVEFNDDDGDAFVISLSAE